MSMTTDSVEKLVEDVRNELVAKEAGYIIARDRSFHALMGKFGVICNRAADWCFLRSWEFQDKAAAILDGSLVTESQWVDQVNVWAADYAAARAADKAWVAAQGPVDDSEDSDE